jgi:flagellar motor switch protein FliN/FliY
MGSAATTLGMLLNQTVTITTPNVSYVSWDELADSYDRPCVFLQIKYVEGLDGNNVLVLKENDVKIITDLMMGGDGTNLVDQLTDLHLSAICEAMNQMMGSARIGRCPSSFRLL